MPSTDLLVDVEPDVSLPHETLVGIACGMAEATALWRAHVHHDPAGRHPVRLLATDAYEVWVIGWTEGQGVDMHDHGGSAGVLVVVEGELVERRPGTPARSLPSGSTTELPRTVVHEVVNRGAAPATSIHVYSPPLIAMGYYDEDGGRSFHLEPVVEEPVVLGVEATARALHPAGGHG